MHYYKGVNDLNSFYLKFRNTVFTTCPSSAPVYLALEGDHQKFREMAVLYLSDREVRSDWMDDGYIYPELTDERRTQALNMGDCVVEPIDQGGSLSKSSTVGSYRVGVFDGQGKVRITSVSGAYDRETDGNNWWYWVEHKVIFKLQPLVIPKDATETKLRFEYGTRGRQTLTLRIIKRDGSSQEIQLHSKGDVQLVFEKIIDLPPAELTGLSIETDGKASPLSARDVRMAAWIVRNVTITLVSP
jgi:hypothetical protein